MLFLLATLAAASPATLPAGRPPAEAQAPHRCLAPQITYAIGKAGVSGLHRLNEEPAATQFLAVDRNVGGCPAPAVVRTGIGR